MEHCLASDLLRTEQPPAKCISGAGYESVKLEPNCRTLEQKGKQKDSRMETFILEMRKSRLRGELIAQFKEFVAETVFLIFMSVTVYTT